MTKHLITTIITLFFSLTIYSQTDWAKSFGGSSLDEGTDIFFDNQGFIYTTGYYQGSVNFDSNGSSMGTLVSAGERDFFIAKYDNFGNLVWVKSIGGASNDQGRSIVVDGTGNIYVAGDFGGIVDFDPGLGFSLQDVEGNSDIFLAKYNAQGQFIWVKTFGGNGIESCRDLVIDGNGDLLITGVFEGTADFDPNGGVVSMTSAGDYDSFILKLDNAGNFLWSKSIQSTNNNFINQIVMDYSGNINVVGYFQGTADFDPSSGSFTLTAIGIKNIFFGKYNAQGDLIFARKIGGSGFEEGKGIAIDLQNNIYITGDFRGVVDFDPSTNTTFLTSKGLRDVFLAKYDTQGNILWANRVGGEREDQASALAIDDNEIYLAAFYSNNMILDNHQLFTSKGNTDIFMARYDLQGNILFATSHGGSNGDATGAIVVNNKELYSIGWIQGTSYFTGIPLSSAGDRDIYIARTIMENLTLTTTFSATAKVNFFPNPVSDYLNISIENIAAQKLTILMVDATGKIIYTALTNVNGQEVFNTFVDVSQFAKGLYFVQIATNHQVITKKIFVY